jgi:hypothetical protein
MALLALLETAAWIVFFALMPQVLHLILRNERTLWVSRNLEHAVIPASIASFRRDGSAVPGSGGAGRKYFDFTTKVRGCPDSSG